MAMQGNSESLTGVWHGLYAGDSARRHVNFVATLLETVSFVSGATHEPRAVGGTPGDVLFATLMGDRAARSVRFTKSYEVADADYTVVEYEGTLSTDGTEIDGRWTIPGNCSGTFLMIRSSQTEAVRSRKVTVDA
jgi:hypothetical protein